MHAAQQVINYMSILFYGHWQYYLSVVSAACCLTTLQILLRPPAPAGTVPAPGTGM
jgi:hypothetical protein